MSRRSRPLRQGSTLEASLLEGCPCYSSDYRALQQPLRERGQSWREQSYLFSLIRSPAKVQRVQQSHRECLCLPYVASIEDVIESHPDAQRIRAHERKGGHGKA